MPNQIDKFVHIMIDLSISNVNKNCSSLSKFSKGVFIVFFNHIRQFLISLPIAIHMS